MSVIAEAIANLTAEALSHVPVRALRRIASAGVRVVAFAFYALGRGVLALVRAPKSQTGVPEAVVGFLIVMGIVTALIKLPVRLMLAALMR